MKTETKKDSIKTLELTKLDAVTGGAWNGWGSSSWHQPSNNWSPAWSAQNWSAK